MSIRLRPPSQLKTLLNSSARPMAGESGAPIRAAGTERQHCSAFNNGEPTVAGSAAVNGFVVNDADKLRRMAVPVERREPARMTQDAGSAEGFRKGFLQFDGGGTSNAGTAGAMRRVAFGKDHTLSGSGIGTVIRLSSASSSLACVKRPDSLFSGFRCSVSDQGSS